MPQADLQVIHGTAFVMIMSCTYAIPALRRWPWVWLAPLLGYFLLVACIPRLRRSLVWLRLGRLSAPEFLATIGVVAGTMVVLLAFHAAAKPDVREYSAALPFGALGGVFMAGAVFTTVNATMEELVFRGVLFDALQSQWGIWATLIVTALLFGLGHLRGYPSGFVGAGLAAFFGFLVGALRLWTGGLALPILAHMAADATIYSILVESGAI